MRNFIKAELYVALKNKAYRIMLAIVSGFVLLLNILLTIGAVAPQESDLFRARIQGFSFMFIFGIMGMAIVTVIALNDLAKGGAIKNAISSGLDRWKYVVGKLFVSMVILVAYLVILLSFHLLIGVVIDGTQAFSSNLPMVKELVMTLVRASFFWMVWLTVLIAFGLLLPNVGVGVIIGTILTGNFTTILAFIGAKIAALQEPITYVVMRLPSTVMNMFYSAYLKTTTEPIFHVPVPSADVYLVSGAVAILVTAIGILAFRKREL